jgi:hypothetical protein
MVSGPSTRSIMSSAQICHRRLGEGTIPMYVGRCIPMQCLVRCQVPTIDSTILRPYPTPHTCTAVHGCVPSINVGPHHLQQQLA